MPNERNDLENLYREMPLRYRLFAKLLLKLPNPRIPFFVLRRFPLFEGIFYGLMLPVFVFLTGFLTLWLFLTMTSAFGFPLNIMIVLFLPAVVLVIFVRIQLERTINWRRSIFSSSTEWDISKRINEFIELFEKQQRRSHGKSE